MNYSKAFLCLCVCLSGSVWAAEPGGRALLSAPMEGVDPVSPETRYLLADPGEGRMSQWRTLAGAARAQAAPTVAETPRRGWLSRLGLTSSAAPVAPESLRIIGEVTSPVAAADVAPIVARIDAWQQRGYNAALCVWYGEQDISGLAALMHAAADREMSVILVIGTQGPWDVDSPCEVDPRWRQWDATPYHDVAALQTAMRELAPLADYILPLWRGSAPIHWWDYYRHQAAREPTDTIDPDMLALSAYADTIARLAVSANPTIGVVGVIQRAANIGYKTRPWAWCPDYAKVILATGIGQQRSGIDVWPRKVRAWASTVMGKPCPPVILGPVFWPEPYWKLRANKGWYGGQQLANLRPVDKDTTVHSHGKTSSNTLWLGRWHGQSTTAPTGANGPQHLLTGEAKALCETWANSHVLRTRFLYAEAFLGCGCDLLLSEPVPPQHKTRRLRLLKGWDFYNDYSWKHPVQGYTTIDSETEKTVDWVLSSTNVFGVLRLVGDGSGPRRGNSDRVGYHPYPWP